MSEHTKEPWVSTGRYIGVPNHKSYIAECRDQNGNWTNELMPLANGRRIVACVNACKGVSTESLEQDVVAKLLAACESVRADTKRVVDRGYVEETWISVADKTLSEAIAAAKGKRGGER